jgi:hypothetical protein
MIISLGCMVSGQILKDVEEVMDILNNVSYLIGLRSKLPFLLITLPLMIILDVRSVISDVEDEEMRKEIITRTIKNRQAGVPGHATASKPILLYAEPGFSNTPVNSLKGQQKGLSSHTTGTKRSLLYSEPEFSNVPTTPTSSLKISINGSMLDNDSLSPVELGEHGGGSGGGVDPSSKTVDTGYNTTVGLLDDWTMNMTVEQFKKEIAVLENENMIYLQEHQNDIPGLALNFEKKNRNNPIYFKKREKKGKGEGLVQTFPMHLLTSKHFDHFEVPILSSLSFYFVRLILPLLFIIFVFFLPFGILPSIIFVTTSIMFQWGFVIVVIIIVIIIVEIFIYFI